MDYKALEKKIESGNIKEGDIVWICDYRLNENLDEKPIRHVVPTEVMIVNNENLPKNKKVYYSSYHFRTLNKKREASSTIIAPYDNTGYRLYSGISLNIFKKEPECRNCFKEQCLIVTEKINQKKDEFLKTIKRMENAVNEDINQYCK